MTKDVLVTGGAGFIGSRIAERLLSEGHQVTIADNFSTGSEKNIPEGARIIRADLSTNRGIKKIPEQSFDAVFHLAGQSSGEISSEKPEVDLKSNTLSTLLLLKWCKSRGIERFIYASSMAVYGNAAKCPVSEKDPCSPLSFYGISKYSSEQYIRHFSHEGIDTTCFRMFSVYGPGQDLKNMKQGMVSIFLAYLLKKEQVLVKGSGERYRDFIYIDDVVDVWCRCIDTSRTFGQIYNLASGKKTFVKDLVEKQILLFGHDPAAYPVRYEGSTPADQFGLYADISKLKKDMEWHPVTDLDTGLRKMIAWAESR